MQSRLVKFSPELRLTRVFIDFSVGDVDEKEGAEIRNVVVSKSVQIELTDLGDPRTSAKEIHYAVERLIDLAGKEIARFRDFAAKEK